MKEIFNSKNKSSNLSHRIFNNNSSKTLLLLHGFLGNQHIWDPLIPKLSTHFNLVTIDLPGHGDSTSNLEILKMDFIADQIIGLIDQLKIDKVHIIGHSMGGYVGLEMLHKIPTRIDSLSLLNSTAYDDTPQKKEDRLRAAKVFDLNPSIFIKDAIRNLFYDKNLDHLNDQVEHLQEIALGTSSLGAKASLKGMRERKNHINLVNTTTIPIQYISGIHDTTVTFKSIQEQIKSDSINLVIMEHSGHMSFAEEKTKCEDSIINFINQI